MRAAGLGTVELVPPPAGGFWRVTDWPDPFDPKPPPHPVGAVPPEQDHSGRWDSDDGSFSTLYCSTDPEGAIAEKLADFAQNAVAVIEIMDFLEDDVDPEFAGDYLTGELDADDIEGFDWTLAHADAHAGVQFIDVWHWRTCVAITPAVAGLLVEHGLSALDRRALADERRGFTRRLGSALRQFVVDDEDGQLGAAGLRYESRLAAGWECWALWEPLPIDAGSVERTRVSIETPELRSAAAKLGVPVGA
jgi:hypothetical protein